MVPCGLAVSLHSFQEYMSMIHELYKKDSPAAAIRRLLREGQINPLILRKIRLDLGKRPAHIVRNALLELPRAIL